MKINVNTKVKLNLDVIAKLEGEARDLALYQTADWVLTEVIASGKVPKELGTLEQSGFIKVIADNIVLIVFDTPYARRWYFNSEKATFNQSYNANATDHWMDDFIHGDRREELIEKFKEFYIEELGGLLT